MTSKQNSRPFLPTLSISANNGTIKHIPKQKHSTTPSVKTPGTKKSIEEDWRNIDPDDLFVRFTVPEIRNIQEKLRAEADAKQEELRLMVGERYRDLLQASTSIISIADSSKRVITSLAEMREAMVSDEDEQKPRRPSIRGEDDAHLKKLRSLSAHLKLLLDTPEHLWRLLEKKQHLPAAWLFLLARIVHRALITDDPEENWEQEGINVNAQYPLVQRQWETVAQFRSQIAHRATIYLREPSISSEVACSTMLTLHLLDSLPLSETLSTFLSQRSRTLNALFLRNLDFRPSSRSSSPLLGGRWKNREKADTLLSSLSSTTKNIGPHRKNVVKFVQIAILDLLDVIGGTISIAANVFRPKDNKKSLIESSLMDIQADTLSNSSLAMTTPSLLSTLPSSTHLLTLPQSILSYKPYIDLTSPSTHVDPPSLDNKLSMWFDKSLHGFEGRIRAWFECLETIREVWGVRRKVLQKLQAIQGIGVEHRERIQFALDDGMKRRMDEVTRTALKDVEGAVDNILKKSVQAVREEIEETRLDVAPATYLFSPPSTPSVSHLTINTNSAMTSFESFKSELRRRADGRTPSLARVLDEIEYKAEELKEDLEVIKEGDETSRELRQQIMDTYQPAAHRSLIKIIDILQELFSLEGMNVEGPSEKSIIIIVFLGRVSRNMASSSFAQSLHSRDEALQGFRDSLEALHERSLMLWRAHSVLKALEQYTPMTATMKDSHADNVDFAWPTQPTPHLIMSLFSLATSLQQLGLPRADLRSKNVTTNLMYDFNVSFANKVPMGDFIRRQDQAQLLWDLTFMGRFSHAQIGSSDALSRNVDGLSEKAAFLQSRLCLSMQEEARPKFTRHIARTVDVYILRCQTLLAPLIGTFVPFSVASVSDNTVEEAKENRVTALLPYGASATDQEFRPAIEVVGPSARLGLLLVGSTAVRH